MRYTVIAVGKLKESWWREAAAEYLKRLRSYGTIEIAEVADRDLTRDEQDAVAREGEDITKLVPEGAYVVALDGRGKQRDSVGFSEWLADLGLQGRSHVAFVIGGAAGLSDEARVLLLEQLYRAHRIQRGEPYHR